MNKNELKTKLLSLGIVKENEYLDFYCTLIENNLNTIYEKRKTERHHIIPKGYFKYNNLDSDDSSNNLVNLTHFDHCLAHYYLCNCTIGKLKYSNEHAFIKMVNIKSRFDFNLEDFMKNIDNYEKVYNSFCKHQSELNSRSCIKRGGGTNKGRKCFTNGIKTIFAVECPEGYWPSCTNKKKKLSEETKSKMKIAAQKRCNNPEYINNLKKSIRKYYEEHKGQIKACNKNKKFITNGIISRYIAENESLPEGWWYGLSTKRNKNNQK